MSTRPAQRPAEWLDRLAQASEPLSLVALFGRSPGKAQRRHLDELLAAGSVVNLARKPGFALATAEDATGRLAPARLAESAVRDHLGLGLQPLPLSASGLGKVKAAPFVRPHLLSAVASLVQAGELIPIRVGSASLVLGAAGVRQHLADHGLPSPASAASQAPADLTDDAVESAYRALLAPGMSMVTLGALRRQLDCGVATLHGAVQRLLAERRVLLVKGDPVFVPVDERDAALGIGGVTYYCIEFAP